MRQATTILVMIMASVGCAADDDDDDDDDSDANDTELFASEEEGSTAAPTHDPDNCPGGGGGPGPQPERKRCLPSDPDEICLDCCLYNYNYVDGWKCRQTKNRKKREACWRRASEVLGKYQRDDCDRYGPITTIRVQ